MQVMWVSTPEHYDTPFVEYSAYPSFIKSSKAEGKYWTYDAGHIGFHGRIYYAVMTNLTAGQKYFYRVGDHETGTFSEIKYFEGPPNVNQKLSEIRYAVAGDVGTYAPEGHTVLNQIAVENFAKRFSFMYLTGDIAYAGVSSESKG